MKYLKYINLACAIICLLGFLSASYMEDYKLSYYYAIVSTLNFIFYEINIKLFDKESS